MQKRSKIISATLAFLLLFQIFALVTNPSVNAAGALKVEMYMGNTSQTTNTISPNFKITNNGSATLSLPAVTIRYYFTKDGNSTQNFNCNVSGVTGSFVDITTPTPIADNYLEVHFSAGTLASKASIELNTSISKADGSNYNQANDYSFNSTNTGYSEWSKSPAYISNIKIWGSEPAYIPNGFLIIVSSKIYEACQTELNTYMSDLVNENWSPTIIKVNNVPDSNFAGDESFHVCENPDALKQVIRGYYDQGYKGFVLVGSAPSIPNVYWESSPTSNEKVPTDLFYADMSDWSDSDGDGSYEQPVNPVPDKSELAPDMICGRISAAGAISNPDLDEATKTLQEISKTKGYFQKIHDFRSSGGEMDFDPKGFCFTEDDWPTLGSQRVSAMKGIEKDIYCVTNKTLTNKESFLQYLQGGYRLGYEIVHAWQEGWALQGHPYGTEDAPQSEGLSVDEINGITVKVNYLHLDSCSACDYTTKNIGATILFNNTDTYSTSGDSYVYNVTGDTEPAHPAINGSYYQDLKSMCIGAAFKNFILSCITNGFSTDYPFYILLGDPTLKYNFTKPTNTCPEILNDFSDVTAYPGKQFKLNFQTADSENDPVFLDVSGLPEGANFDSSTKTIDWTPLVSQVGNHKVIITAYNKDVSGEIINKNVQEFIIYVSKIGVLPCEIPNSGFETLNADGTPSDWTPTTSGGTLTSDQNVKYGGDYSARITSDTYYAYNSCDKDITVKPYTRYLISGYIKTSNVTTPYATGAILNLQGNAEQLGVNTNSLAGTQEWTQVYKYWYSGNNTSLKIRCRLEGTGTAWFDNIKVEEDHNLGFEFYGDNISTGVDKWNNINVKSDPNAVQLDSSVKHYGFRSGRILFNQEPNYGMFSSTLPVQPNTNYRIGVWVKTSNISGGSAGLTVICGSDKHEVGQITDTNNEWTRVYMDFNSGSNTQITVNCRLGAVNKLTTGTAWFDDVTLEKK